jgi:exosortase A-associated hydrolase 1
MSWQESAVVFPCQGEHLVGVITGPSSSVPATGLGVLVVVGGPQYRVGAHRQFVQFARALAAQGHSVLRFDARGMGDSSGAPRNFEQLDDDIAAALDAIQRECTAARRYVIAGLCDGATAAWMYLDRTKDPRVAGVCMANPWARSDTTLAKVHLKHYYTDRLKQAAFWRKLLTGKVGTKAIADVLRAIKLALGLQNTNGPETKAALPFQTRMARACTTFPGPQLIVLSEDDLTAREFSDRMMSESEWAAASVRPSIAIERLSAADHTFSSANARIRFEQTVLSWLEKHFGRSAASESSA